MFTVPGDHPFDQLLIDGSTPDSGSDVLDFDASGAGTVTVNLFGQSITETVRNPVTFSGIELVDINARDNTLAVGGTPDNDTFNVTPRDAGSGLFDHNGSPGVAFEYINATTTTFSGGGGSDELNVLGDAVADTVTSAASAITVDGSTVTLGSWARGSQRGRPWWRRQHRLERLDLRRRRHDSRR